MQSRQPILITSPSFSRSKVLMQELGDLGFYPIGNMEGRKLAGRDLIDFLNQEHASIAIVGTEKISKDILGATPHLRFISKYGVGLDNIDLEAMQHYSIALGWTPGVNKRSVAELILALALGHFRQVIPSVRRMMNGIWLKEGGRQISETTLGIIGLGNTGGELAKITKPLVKNIVYFDIQRNMELEKRLDLQFCSFEQVLKACDWISFNVPLTDLTFNMMNGDALSLLKPHCLVINASRGEVVNFDLALDALKSGRIGGFACDVYIDEPFDASFWKDLYNFYPTPHIGGNSLEAVNAMGKAAIEHAKKYVANAFIPANSERGIFN
jgi:D-3-phosphoglycerate dehydrogenase